MKYAHFLAVYCVFMAVFFLTYVLLILKQDAVPSQVYLRLGAVA